LNTTETLILLTLGYSVKPIKPKKEKTKHIEMGTNLIFNLYQIYSMDEVSGKKVYKLVYPVDKRPALPPFLE
jgi:hypothetical protein